MISPKTELRFYFLRHGESEDNTNLEVIGGKDPQITMLGLKQAKALGIRLSKENIKFDKIFCSPLQRVVHTCKAVCANLLFDFRKVVIVPALKEMDMGFLAGDKKKDIYEGHAGRLINYLGPWFTPPGGESQKMVQRRVSAWLEEEFLRNESLLKSEKTLNFGIFGSGMNFKCLFQEITGWDASLTWKFTLDNCSISRFRLNEKGWFIDCINDTGHLLGLLS